MPKSVSARGKQRVVLTEVAVQRLYDTVGEDLKPSDAIVALTTEVKTLRRITQTNGNQRSQ